MSPSPTYHHRPYKLIKHIFPVRANLPKVYKEILTNSPARPHQHNQPVYLICNRSPSNGQSTDKFCILSTHFLLSNQRFSNPPSWDRGPGSKGVKEWRFLLSLMFLPAASTDIDGFDAVHGKFDDALFWHIHIKGGRREGPRARVGEREVGMCCAGRTGNAESPLVNLEPCCNLIGR